MVKTTGMNTQGKGDMDGLSEMMGGGSETDSIVEGMEGARNGSEEITLPVSDFPELEGRKEGDRVQVTISGVVTGISGGLVTLSPASGGTEQNSPPVMQGQ